ncbi:hypothetical protein BGZ95_006559, partial [Linnemannia exigua]
DASRLAVDVKREAQHLIGQFLEKLRTRIDAEVAKARGQKKNGEMLSEPERLKGRRDALSGGEREILYNLAGNIKPKREGSDEEENQDGVQFLLSFLTYLYSRNPPKKATKVGGAVDAFINILAGMDLFNITHARGELNKTLPFTPTHVVRSVAGQLAVELKKTYQNGSNILYDKVRMTKTTAGLASAYLRPIENIHDDSTSVTSF